MKIEVTGEDAGMIRELAEEVVRIMNNAGLDGEDRTALAPMVWQEVRAAHSTNKSQRVQQEMQQKAKELGMANQLGPSAQGYYGQKL